MKKLQKREKVLLIVLLVILVAVVPFVLLIFPVMQQNTGKADTLAVLEVSRMEMETRLAAKPALETALAEIEERYAENEELIPPAMKNYDIHYLVSDICSKAGVTLDSLSIGEYEAAGDGTDGSQQPEQEQSAFLSRVVLQFTATGNFEQTANVLEQLYELPYMVVTEFYIDMENPQLPSATSIQAELYAVAQPGDAALDAAATEAEQAAQDAADAAGA